LGKGLKNWPITPPTIRWPCLHYNKWGRPYT